VVFCFSFGWRMLFQEQDGWRRCYLLVADNKLRFLIGDQCPSLALLHLHSLLRCCIVLFSFFLHCFPLHVSIYFRVSGLDFFFGALFNSLLFAWYFQDSPVLLPPSGLGSGWVWSARSMHRWAVSVFLPFFLFRWEALRLCWLFGFWE